jgi:hypothetical protein
VILVSACAVGAWLVWLHWKAQPWSDRAVELGGPAQFRPLDPQMSRRLLALAANWWRPTLGLFLLAAGGLLGRVVSAGRQARRISVAAAWALVALIGVYWVEDRLLVATIRAAQSGRHLNAYGLWLQGFAFLEDALLPIAGLVAVIGATTALFRLLARLARLALPTLPAWLPMPTLLRRLASPTPQAELRATVENQPGEQENGEEANWRCNMELPHGRKLATEGGEQEGLGICLSGGGIRSASFALGALQTLQDKDLAESLQGPDSESVSELMSAKYITAVSGGSYTAGAFVLAVHKKEEGETERKNERPVDNLDYDKVFTPGSPEFDHLRRHSSYIADGLREWSIAVFAVLRGAFLSTLILGSLAMTAGLWVGHLYNRIRRAQDLDDPWHPVWGPVFVTACIAGIGLLLWVISTMEIHPLKLRRTLAEIAKMTWLAVAVLVTLGAAIPIVTWASMHIIQLSGGTGAAAGGLALGAAKGGALGVIGVITTILGLMSRQRTRLVNAMRSTVRTWQQQLGDIGKRSFEWLCVYTGLAIVAAVYLILFGYSTHLVAFADPDTHPAIRWGVPPWVLPLSNFEVAVYLTALLIVLYLLVDETAIGLHHFYRRRLAAAFAVRRVAVRETGAPDAGQAARNAEQAQSDKAERTGGKERYEARAYDWYEGTPLDEYGASLTEDEHDADSPQHGKSFPQVIFCASAHCSDPDETPPGRHVLPFTFSHDYVGGPEIKWYPTRKMRERRSQQLQADLTVQAAMAASGAAFASATGSYQGAANLILALANARLGMWLPNPSQLKLIDSEDQWWRPRPPWIRRLSYLLREIFGWYPQELPLVYVADGGQYENLGLIELLRHRCTEIYCFDATSDIQVFGESLARSIMLAASELGVVVTLDEPERADPHADGERADGGDLKGRIAKAPVITAKLTYPACGQGGPRDGFLVIGRATMDEGTPWEIRRHAATHRLFPNDATGDQWFDDCKFNAYTGLGRYVGKLAKEEMRKYRAHRSLPSHALSENNGNRFSPQSDAFLTFGKHITDCR